MSAESSQANLFFECRDNQNLKLKAEEINYYFTVKGSIGYHDLNISYHNKWSSGKVQFLFCLSEDTCFDHLSVKVDDKIINCVVKEKEEAKQEYQNAIQQGKTASLGQLSDTRGYFRVDIGNIDANKNFNVQFKYIEQLQLIDNCYIMNFPFKKSVNGKYEFKNLNITGDIYSEQENDEILSVELQNCKKKSSIEFSKIKKNHLKLQASFLNEIVKIKQKSLIQTTSLKVKYEKESIALLSSFQNDSEISPYCALVNYVPQLYAVKQSLNLNEKQVSLIKSEFIILIDRSGSMNGSRMQMAKESLILFLKSLPEGSIYNIISFGSSYRFMHNESMQFNDQNIEDSIGKIQDFTADMGGTNISKALEDLFQNLQDQYGLRKKIFILTDGEFSDNEQAIQVVEKYKQRCEINILSIETDQEIKNSQYITSITGGFIQSVKDDSQITSSVIQLLKDSFQNYQNVTMKLESDHDDCINYIIPNPSLIQYVDTTKTLRFYIFFNRKLEDIKKVNFKLQTNISNKSFTCNYSIKINSQISNEQAHIHKMGLYAMIRQLIINQKRKTVNMLDDISSSIKIENDKLKELFTNEAIRYQILCEYTAFVGKTQELNVNDFLREQDIILGQNNQRFCKKKMSSNYCEAYTPSQDNQISCNYRYFAPFKSDNYHPPYQADTQSSAYDPSLLKHNDFQDYFQGYDYHPSQNNQIFSKRKMSTNSSQASIRSSQASNIPGSISISFSKQNDKKSAGCCGGGGGSFGYNSKQKINSTIRLVEQQDDSQSFEINSSYQKIISMQQSKGLWKNSVELLSLLKISELQFNSSNPIDKSIPNCENIWITLIVIYWLKEFCTKDINKHQYVLLKAIGITERLKKQYNINYQDQQLKDIFKHYKQEISS